MKEDAKSQRRIFFFALLASLALHVLFILFIPSSERKAEPEPEKIMTVRLIAGKSEKKAAPQAQKPKSESAERKTEKKKELPKPVAKIKEPKTNKTINKAADVPEETSAPQNGSETDVPQGSDSTGDSGAESGNGGGTGGSAPTGDANGIVDASVLKVTKKVIPDYPSFSRKRKEEGTVFIIVTIENNAVIKSEIEQTSGHDRLDSSAQRAAKQWRFDCKERVRARIPFAFKLK